MVQRVFLRLLYEKAQENGEPLEALPVGREMALSRSQITALVKMLELSGLLEVLPGG